MSRVLPGSTAEVIGLRAGDKLVAIDGRAIGEREEALTDGLAAIRGRVASQQRFEATVERGGRELTVGVPPLADGMPPAAAEARADGRAAGRSNSERSLATKPPPATKPSLAAKPSLGVELSSRVMRVERRRVPPLRAVSLSASAVAREARSIADALLALLGRVASGGRATGLQGPLGIAQMGSQIASTDAAKLLDFAALLSLNLAVFNSLPIQGGRW